MDFPCGVTRKVCSKIQSGLLEVKKFYNVDPEEEHAATLDHLVGAVGG
jgi:hypothetical protein